MHKVRKTCCSCFNKLDIVFLIVWPRKSIKSTENFAKSIVSPLLDAIAIDYIRLVCCAYQICFTY